MGISEEEQMAAMLKEMGMDSIDEIDTPLGDFNPVPEGPVRLKRPEEDKPLAAKEDSNIDSSLSVEPELPQESVASELPLEQTAPSADTTPLSVSSANLRSPSDPTQREISVSTLLHIMGMPTGKQISVLDSKLDLVLAKFISLQSKVDRLHSQIDVLTANSSSERLEFQVNEIRSIMKKFFPQAFQGNAQPQKPLVSSSSGTTKYEKVEKKKETSVHIDVPGRNEKEEVEPLTDEEYQALESDKLKQEMMSKYNK